MLEHSELEKAIELARNSHIEGYGGMGSVEIAFDPYECKWCCKFNWSSNQPISGYGDGMEEAIYAAIEACKVVKAAKG